MKKISLVLCILLLIIFTFSLTSCKLNDYVNIKSLHFQYNGMHFWLIGHKEENEKDDYFMAGDLLDKDVVNYFIPMTIRGYPVREFGFARFTNPSAGSIFLKDKSLRRLYMPGTITGPGGDYEYFEGVHKKMQVYYCGNTIDMYCIYSYGSEVSYYVPADRIDEFVDALGTTTPIGAECGLYKANIAYRLNAEDMCEYYYVDNVEAGLRIVNIPPKPTRKGYKFDGWYTEKECINKWDFYKAPAVSDNDDNFVEFSLYAKWIKK